MDVSLSSFTGGPYLLQNSGTSITQSTLTPAAILTNSTTFGTDVTGTYNSLTLINRAGSPGTYGNNISCLFVGTWGQNGLISNPACFSIAGFFEPFGVNSTFVSGLNIVITNINNATIQIATVASPSFVNMVLSGPAVKSLLATDNAGNVVALTLGANTFAYGTNAGSAQPVAGSFTTATGMVFTYGATTIQVDTPQVRCPYLA